MMATSHLDKEDPSLQQFKALASSGSDEEWRKALHRVTKHLNKCIAGDQVNRKLRLFTLGSGGELEKKLKDLEHILKLYHNHIRVSSSNNTSGDANATSTGHITCSSAVSTQKQDCAQCKHLGAENRELLSELEHALTENSTLQIRTHELERTVGSVRGTAVSAPESESVDKAYDLLSTAKQNVRTIESLREELGTAREEIKELKAGVLQRDAAYADLWDVKSKLEVCWVAGEEHVSSLEKTVEAKLKQIKEIENRSTALQNQNSEFNNKITYLKSIIRWQNEKLVTSRGVVRVSCRVKPFRAADARSGNLVLFHYPHRKVIDINGCSSTFDKVFRETSTEQDIYEDLQPSVKAALYGINACILCYGAASSGKTRTLLGTGGSSSSGEAVGIIERAVQTLLGYSEMEATENEYRVSLSIAQLDHDSIFDVVEFTRKPLDVRGKNNNAVIEGLSSTVIHNIEDYKACLRRKDYNLAGLALYPGSDGANLRGGGSGVEVDRGGSSGGQKPEREYHQMFFLKIEKRRRDHNLHASRLHRYQQQQLYDSRDGDFNSESDDPSSAFCTAGQVVFVNLASLHVTQHLRPEHFAAVNSFTASLSSTNELNSLENVLKSLKNNERQVPYRASKLTYALQSVLNQQSSVNFLVHVNPILTGADTYAYYSSTAAVEGVSKSRMDDSNNESSRSSSGDNSPEAHAAKRCIQTLSVNERIARDTAGVV